MAAANRNFTIVPKRKPAHQSRSRAPVSAHTVETFVAWTEAHRAGDSAAAGQLVAALAQSGYEAVFIMTLGGLRSYILRRWDSAKGQGG